MPTLPPMRHKNSGKAAALYEHPKHLRWVRRHACSSCGHCGDPVNRIQAAHVRLGTGGGTGFKPADRWTVSLCERCHDRQHGKGERTFWRLLNIEDPKALAEEFARKSPFWAELKDMP